MKTNQIFIFGSWIVLAASQSLDSLPECGKLCVNNMFAKARELGCADGDTACLCKNINFAYGIRDCSTTVCGAQAAAPVIVYGANYCNSVSSGNGSGTVGGNGTTSGGGNGAIPPPAPGLPSSPENSLSTVTNPPIATSTLLSTISSGDSVATTTLGITTIYSSNDGTKPTDSPSGEHSGSSATSSLTSNSAPSPSQTDDQPSSSSSGSGARQTAYAGLAAAAGFAAMLL